MLRGSKGAPIVGALVSLTSPAEGDEVSWSGPDPRGVERASSFATTDPAGRARFPELPAASLALWATRADRVARGAWIDAKGVVNVPPLVLELDPANPLRVRVVDADGAPAEGARVVQVVHDGARAGARGTNDAAESPLARAFFRASMCDELGEAPLYPHELECVVWASRGALVSAPAFVRLGDGPNPLVLTLGEACTAGGSVRFPDGRAPDEPVRVHAYRLGGAERVPCGSARVQAGGSWGPLTLALEGAAGFLFRVEGADLVAVEEQRAAPAAGSHLRVDFAPRFGIEAIVHVVEASETAAPIAAARASVTWQAEGAWRWADARTDESGVARVRGCDAGQAWIRADREGFESTVLAVPELGAARGAPFELRLARAGRIRGTCTCAGDPVRDFQVFYWRGDPRARNLARFQGRDDGSFEIASAPLGRVTLVASSPSAPEGAPLEVEVVAGEAVDVALELPRPVLGRGRVVDAASGAPIADAYVLPQATYADAVLGPRGAKRPVRADGSFEYELFPASDARAEFGAPEYASESAPGALTGEGVVDFGTVALARFQPLEVRLVASSAIDGARLRFQAEGPSVLPYTSFPPSGVLRFDSVAPGRYEAFLVWPEGASVRRVVDLVPGAEWRIEFELDDCPPLEVEVAAPPDVEIPARSTVSIDWIDGGGVERSFTAQLPEDRRLRAESICGDELDVDLFAPGNVLLAATHARVAEKGPRRVRLELVERGLEVRVLDVAREPLAGARVRLSSPRNVGRWDCVAETDARGAARFAGLGFDAVVVSAYHPSAGLAAGELVELAREGDTRIELVLDGRDDLVVSVQDRGLPIAGASLDLFAAASAQVLLDRASGEDGRALWPRASHGDYRVEARRAGCWPASASFRFDGGADAIRLELRRLGGLELALRTQEGAPAAGVALELECKELGESVRDWLASGRVRGGVSALTSDAAGRIRLDGLPNGAYVARRTGGVSGWSASIDVPPAAVASVELTLP